LKIDGKDEYAFLINENKYDGDLNTYNKVIDFLNQKYFDSEAKSRLSKVIDVSMQEPALIVKMKDQSDQELKDDAWLHRFGMLIAIILSIALFMILTSI
jgi:hypothetical protein